MSATVLRVGRLFDGVDGRTRARQELRIEAGRITAIGAAGSVTRPGDTVIDHPDATCTPGFLDVHTHFCYPIHGEFQRSGGAAGRLGMLTQGIAQASSWLRQGVTTARDVGTAFDLDVELAEIIQLGLVEGPRIAPSGRMLTMSGGKRNAADHMKDEISGAVAARRWTREHLKRGAVVIKLYATTLLEEDVAGYLKRALATPDGARDPGRWASLSVDEIRAVTHEAHKLGRTVAAHAAPAFGVNLALRGGVDTVEHGSDLDGTSIALFLETGATLVPTLAVSDHQIAGEGPRDPAYRAFALRRWDRIRANVARAHQAGVRIATGTDPVLPGMTYAREIELLVDCGLTPAQALLAATRDAAAALGAFGRDVGTLAPGKHADLLLFGGDPSEHVAALGTLREVWQSGRPLGPTPDPTGVIALEAAHA